MGKIPHAAVGSLSSAAALIDPKQWAGNLSTLQWSRLASASSSGSEARAASPPPNREASNCVEKESATPPLPPPRALSEHEHFEALLERGEYGDAAQWAANSPKQVHLTSVSAARRVGSDALPCALKELRTTDTIQRFQSLQPRAAGDQPPILLYFGATLSVLPLEEE